MNVTTLRAMLGRRVRFSVVLEAAVQRPYPAAKLGAEWNCGCTATGTSFHAMSLSPCNAHGGADLKQAANG